MRIGYIRVSTIEQNDERQRESLNKHDVQKIFSEKVSGKNMKDRKELQAMLDFVREGDTVVCHDFSRLARSTADLLKIVDILTEKKVNLISIKESLDTSTPQGRLMLTMIAAINEFERQNLLERQAEGIAIKKAQDKLLPKEKRTYKGRKAIEMPKDFDLYYQKYMSREMTKSDIAKHYRVSRPTIDKFIANYLPPIMKSMKEAQ